MEKLEKELFVALQLATNAGKRILEIYKTSFENKLKEDGTRVTLADIESNYIINNGLHLAFPQDGIVSEELENVSTQSGRRWYIDPIDGTRGFIKKTGEFAVHIGLCIGDMPVLGIVYQPVTNEMYYGIRGEGAYAVENGTPKLLKMFPTGLQNLTAVAAHPNEFTDEEVRKERFGKLGITKTMYSGSEGLRIRHLVDNRADIHIIDQVGSCSTWDTCAPHALLEAAGGVMQYLDGSPILYYGQRKLGKLFFAAKTLEQAVFVREQLGYLCKM